MTSYGQKCRHLNVKLCVAVCDLPMGVQNPLLVLDKQLSASSSLDIVHGAERGRLYAMKEGSFSGGWVPK